MSGRLLFNVILGLAVIGMITTGQKVIAEEGGGDYSGGGNARTISEEQLEIDTSKVRSSNSVQSFLLYSDHSGGKNGQHIDIDNLNIDGILVDHSGGGNGYMPFPPIGEEGDDNTYGAISDTLVTYLNRSSAAYERSYRKHASTIFAGPDAYNTNSDHIFHSSGEKPINRSDVADHIGVSADRVCEVLVKTKQDGVIELFLTQNQCENYFNDYNLSSSAVIFEFQSGGNNLTFIGNNTVQVKNGKFLLPAYVVNEDLISKDSFE